MTGETETFAHESTNRSDAIGCGENETKSSSLACLTCSETDTLRVSRQSHAQLQRAEELTAKMRLRPLPPRVSHAAVWTAGGSPASDATRTRAAAMSVGPDITGRTLSPPRQRGGAGGGVKRRTHLASRKVVHRASDHRIPDARTQAPSTSVPHLRTRTSAPHKQPAPSGENGRYRTLPEDTAGHAFGEES